MIRLLCLLLAVSQAARINRRILSQVVAQDTSEISPVNRTNLLDLATEDSSESCRCATTNMVQGKDVIFKGCAVHFGQRFGYICYINGGAECEGARLSAKLGVYWRPCPAERKSQVAKQNLLEQLEGINSETISKLAATAKELGVDAATLALVKERLTQIEMLMDVKTELMDALAGFSHANLVKAAKEADKYELFEFLDAGLKHRIEARATFLKTKDEKEHALTKAMKTRDLENLRAMLKSAKQVRANPTVLQQGNEAVAALEAKMEEVENELDEALQGFHPVKLTRAAEKAKKYGILEDDTERQVEKRIAFLKTTGAKEEELQQAMKGTSVFKLEFALKAANRVDADPRLLQEAKDTVRSLIKTRNEAKKELMDALKGFDLESLSAAAQRAKMYDLLGTSTEKNIDERTEFLKSKAAKENALMTAMRGIDLAKLQDALSAANLVHANPKLMEQGNEAVRALEKKRDGVDAVEAFFEAAKRLGVATPSDLSS